MAHDSNPTPPSEDASFIVAGAGEVRVAVEALRALPGLTLPDALIASTGHPASGPFAFGGAPLRTVIETYAPGTWSAAQVSSGDGFGTRIMAREWLAETARPILLAHTIDGRPMTRAEGLVRLIVPTETDEALRQVKWVAEVRLLP